MTNLGRIIREEIDRYLGSEEGIAAVLFDFDLTLFDTLSLRNVDKEFIRNTKDVSSIQDEINGARVYDGIPQMIDQLRDRGIKVGIVSNRHECIINDVLEKNGISMDTVVGERLNCPKGIRIRDALSKLGVEPKNAIYVGDSPWDNAEASKVGVTFVGATWGNKKLRMGYNNPSELIRYVDYINN